MPYVERRNGQIIGVYAQRQEGYAEEFIEGDIIIPPRTDDELDLEALNAVLAAKGSVLRALALLILDEINILRQRPAGSPALQPRTAGQFKNALQAKMRSDT